MKKKAVDLQDQILLLQSMDREAPCRLKLILGRCWTGL